MFPLVANLFMENLEQKAMVPTEEEIRTVMWKRYVDDILAIVTQGKTTELLTHINIIDTTNSIKFTKEEMDNNTIAFLEVTIMVNENGELNTKVYRKPTHTNQYLHFESHHPVIHKLGVVRTLLDRSRNIVTESFEHIRIDSYFTIHTGSIRTNKNHL